MVDFQIEPDERGVKIRCADIAILSSIYHGDKLDKRELVSKVREKNTRFPLDGNITSAELYRYCLNHRLSENIRRGYVESDKGEYIITEEGISRMKHLIDSTEDLLENCDF